MKKLLVLVLAVAMLGAYSGLAIAAPGDLSPNPAFSDIAGHPAEAALTALGALSIFSGGYGLGGVVLPDDAINREQYCKVVIIGTERAALAESLKNMKPTFTDADSISRWAWGYVNAATAAGIIKGYAETGGFSFRPKNNVTYAEAVVMLIRSVAGHGTRVDTTGWPYSVIFYGVSNGFMGEVAPPDPNAACTRGDMGRMLFATMQVDPLDGAGVPDTDGAFLEEGHRIWNLKLAGRSGGDLSLFGVMGTIPLGEPVYMLGATDYAACVGNDVQCVATATEPHRVVYISRKSGSNVTGLFKGLGADVGGTYLELKSGQKVYYTAPEMVHLNKDTATPNDQTKLEPGDALTINLDAGGKAVLVTAKRYDLIRGIAFVPHPTPPPPVDTVFPVHPEDVLDKVKPSGGGLNTRISFPNTSPFIFYNGVTPTTLQSAALEVGTGAVVTINGVVSNRDALAKNDVVKIATFGAKGYWDATSIIEVAATRNPVTGTVTENSTVTDSEGNHYYTKLNVGGTVRSFERDDDHYLSWVPTVGQSYTFTRSETAVLFFAVVVPDTFPIVYVKSAATVAGPPDRYYITVDNRGTEQTYETTVNPTAWVQHFARLTVDSGTGKVTGADDFSPAGGYTVASHTATNATIQAGVNTYFGSDPPLVVYRRDGAVYTYIGCAGLTDEWTVWAYLDTGAVAVILYMATP
jgi:hypothetical protein